MTIVENRSMITGGVDTHGSFHVAGAVDANGGLLGVETFAVGRKHYAQLAKWLMSFGPIDKVGVEGTGSYGAGLARYLRGIGITVVEVDRPNRQVRNRKGKSDYVDAVAAARAALSGSATGLPKHRDGKGEAIRVLMVARRSAVDERIQILNQMRTSASALTTRSAPASRASHRRRSSTRPRLCGSELATTSSATRR